MISRAEILRWLREEEPARLAGLYRLADAVRRARVGDQVHLRGLVELSNHCVRRCAYCGIAASNPGITRYRMSRKEILECARQAAGFGFGTVVLQAGEDLGLTGPWVADLVRTIKSESGLAVTLSLGERGEEELALWRAAGADRYLLRFETSSRELYERIHPSLPGARSDRPWLLTRLRALGYEIGSGVMVGIPGQTWESLADDIVLFRELDLDMIGVGPYLRHPATPLGSGALPPAPPGDQATPTEETTTKVVALSRIACPEANIPSTTALATLDPAQGRELGLKRGANVVMPNLTPPAYRPLYEIYPGKACLHETAEACAGCLPTRIRTIGRIPGTGPGGRRKVAPPPAPPDGAQGS